MSPARVPPLAQGGTRIRREGHLVDQLGHPGDGQRAAASFRYQQGVVILEPGKPFGILAPAIVLAVDKNEIHAPAFGRFQGGIADGIPFTAYDARGAQSQSESCCGQGVDVIGVGAAKGEDVALAQHLCLLQMVFELSPLVAGEVGWIRSSRLHQSVTSWAASRGCRIRCRGGELKGAMGSSPVGASVAVDASFVIKLEANSLFMLRFSPFYAAR
jgi:hypothetical protein